jgi:hypothetical protein
MLSRRIVRYMNEYARDIARSKMKTKAFFRSRNQRKKVEMRLPISRPIMGLNACD